MRTNRLYKILVSAYVASVFSEGIILPIYAIFVQKIGGDILEASGAMATFLVVEGVFTILVHRLRWSHEHRFILLIGGWVIWLIGIISYLLISNVFMLFATQVFTALGNAIADPAFDRELARHTDKKMEEFEWGIFEGANSIMSGVAAILGGIIAATYGFTVLIYFMISTASISLITILLYIHRLHQNDPEHPAAIRRTQGRRQIH